MYKNKKASNQGLTLLELTLALLLFSIVIFSSINITSFVLNRTIYIQEQNEQIFNANLAMNTIAIHMYEATSFELETMADGRLHRLFLRNPDFDGTRAIEFRRSEQELRFGGFTTRINTQVMARYIDDIIINIEGNLMYIFVITEAITLTRTIDIRHIEH